MKAVWPFLLLAQACALTSADSPGPDGPTGRGESAFSSRSGKRPGADVTVHAPPFADYDADTMGIVQTAVAIRLANRSRDPMRIGLLHASFSAKRDGVAFPCSQHVGGSTRGGEPSILHGNSDFVFERVLACAMPLPGRYEVHVAIHDGEDENPTGGRGLSAGSFALDVVLGSAIGPKALASRPGLYASMSGRRSILPLPPESWARGDYRVVIGLANGSSHAIPVGSLRLSLLVQKEGSPLPCSGESILLDSPKTIAAGAFVTTRARVTCAPDGEGRYELTGRLTLVESGEEIEIGHVPLDVTRDPHSVVPQPWPHWESHRSGEWLR